MLLATLARSVGICDGGPSTAHSSYFYNYSYYCKANIFKYKNNPTGQLRLPNPDSSICAPIENSKTPVHPLEETLHPWLSKMRREDSDQTALIQNLCFEQIYEN